MDSLLLKERVLGDTPALLAVVCDGVGSTSGGAFAACTATRLLGDWLGRQSETAQIGLKMRDAVVEINAYLSRAAKQNHLCAAATLSALLLSERRYCIVHTGDSRIYAYRDGALTLLTQDQVSQKGRLTSWIGSEGRLAPIYREGAASGSFLLCTDGAYKRLGDQLLLEELRARRGRNQKKTVERLAQCAIARGECDNITLALVAWRQANM